MTLLLPIAALAVIGWIVAFPFVRKAVADVQRIPGSVWRVTGYRTKKQWKLSIRLGYLLGGWPGLLVAVLWRRSDTRETLRDEWHILIEERRARREIVLAHYEDEPNDQPTTGTGT
jgi:hypothetical protein